MNPESIGIAALPPFTPAPVTLEGALVRLEPLTMDHLPALIEAGAGEDVWKWTSIWPPPDPAGHAAFMRSWIESALTARDAGEAVPWATIDLRTGRCIGSTRYLNIRREHRGLEIGWTWLHPSAQRSGINTEAKLLQLIHAFDTLGAIRVEWRTDERNAKSRAAILRLGATFEGIMRSHVIRGDGTLRNTVWCAMTREQWPAARARLKGMLAEHAHR